MFALVVVGLLLAGCTQNQPASPGAGKVTSPVAPAVTPPAAPAVPPAPPVAPPAPPVDAKVEVLRLASLSNSTAWKATYKLDITGGDTSAASITGMSIYSDGRDRSRVDVESEQMNLRAYVTEGATVESVTCFGLGSNWTCMKSSSTPNNTVGQFSDNLAGYTVGALPSRTIAGISASCYNLTGIEDNSTAWVAQCYSSDGMALYVQVASQTETGPQMLTMTATSASRSVSDADFIPPAEPTELPTYPTDYNTSIPDTGNLGE